MVSLRDGVDLISRPRRMQKKGETRACQYTSMKKLQMTQTTFFCFLSSLFCQRRQRVVF